LTAGAATTLTVNSILPGTGLTKYGEGTLVLNGRYLGSGRITVAQGTLQLGVASASLNPTQRVIIMPGATLDLGGSDRTIGTLDRSIGGVDTFSPALLGTNNLNQVSDGTVALGANRLTLSPFVGAGFETFTGNITGTGGLTLL